MATVYSNVYLFHLFVFHKLNPEKIWLIIVPQIHKFRLKIKLHHFITMDFVLHILFASWIFLYMFLSSRPSSGRSFSDVKTGTTEEFF